MIIQDFTLCHTFIPIRISNFIFDTHYYPKNKNIINILNVVLFVIELLLGLVFLEFIELNFCGLSRNIKKNIRKRAETESFDITNEDEKRKIYMINDQYYTEVEDEEEVNDKNENDNINSKLELMKTTN